MYVSVGNLQRSAIPCKLSTEKLVDLVKHVDVRRCIVCTLYIMYVSVGNSQKSMIPYKLPVVKLVGVVKHVDVLCM